MQTDIIVLIIVMSIILIGILLKDTVMHTISLKRAETNCDIVVKSKTTEKEYHVSKYRISESKGMELRIYNPYIGGYDWFTVWHFYSPRAIMRKLNPEYYSQDFSKYRGSEKSINLTHGDKI